MNKRLKIIFLSAVILLGCVIEVSAQQVTYDPNAETYSLLSLNQAFVNLGRAAKEYIRAREQFDTKLVSQQAYDQALDAYKNAKISYDLALMRILNNVSYIIIERAVKRTTPDGSKIVEVTIRNELGGTFELSKLRAFGARETSMAGGDWDTRSAATSSEPPTGMTADEFEDYDVAIRSTLPFLEGTWLAFDDVINLMEINNIFVSLQGRTADNQQVMISNPYERKIAKLTQNERATVQFELLRDVDNLTVNISFGDKTIAKPVYLKLESTAGGVEVDSQIPSLEATMNSSATYNLSLQRFSAGATAFSLRVANLPEQIDYTFLDPDNNNQQVQSVNFTEGAIRKSLQLQLNMPTRASERVLVDQPISFKALVLSTEEVKKFDDLYREHSGDIPEDAVAQLNAGVVDLIVTPKGVGRIEVSASTFFYSIQPDQVVDMTITIKNTGTGELKNVKVDIDTPNNTWNDTIEPDLIQSLMPDQEEKVSMIVQPPAEATVGEHILKVKVEGTDRTRVTEADDKEVTVKIEAKPDIWGRLILIVLLIGIVLGIVIFGIKLSRR